MNSAKRDKQRNDRLGFGLICISFVFYFFPDFSMFDFFPDLIGYILISVGIGKLSHLNDSVEAARKLFLRMILLSVCKVGAIFVAFGDGNAESQASFIMLFIFVFSVAEALVLIPAYMRFFEGLTYLATRNNGTAVIASVDKRSEKSITDKIKNKTIRFIIIKNLALFLPETASMSMTDSLNPYKTEMYTFLPHFRVLGMIISLIAGIVWLVSIMKYFGLVKRDEPFISSLKEKYANRLNSNSDIFAERRIGTAFLFFGAGVLLALDFYLNGNNGRNLIPDALFVVMIVLGIIVIRRYLSAKMQFISFFACVLYASINIANTWLNAAFLEKHGSVGTVKFSPQAFASWKGLLAMSIFDALSFVFLCVVLLAILRTVIKYHTGTLSIHATIDPVAKMAETHKKLNVYITVCFVASIIAAIGGVLRIVLLRAPYFDISDSSWVFELILTAIFAGTFINALIKINEQVKEKYLYQ